MRSITNERMENFKSHLINEEKSEATVSKYLHDVEFAAMKAMKEDVKKAIAVFANL